MASLGALPPELLDQIIFPLACDGPGLLSLRAVNRQYRDYIDLNLPEMAWRLANPTECPKCPDFAWIDNSIDRHLHQIQHTYWEQDSPLCNRLCCKQRSAEARRKFRKWSGRYRATGTEDWWSASGSDLPHVLAMFEHTACGEAVFERFFVETSEWEAAGLDLPETLAMVERNAYQEWWLDHEGSLSAVLAFFEDPLTYPLTEPVQPQPWWRIPPVSAPFILRRLHNAEYTVRDTPYRSLARIRGLITEREGLTELIKILEFWKEAGLLTSESLDEVDFPESHKTTLDRLKWDYPPRHFFRVHKNILFEALNANTHGPAIW